MSALLGVPLLLMGTVAALSGAHLVSRRVRLAGRFSPGIISAIHTVASPLNSGRGVYCRWSITQRHLGRGVSDGVSGEVSAPFEVVVADARHRVALESSQLLLAPTYEEAWTADADGLTAFALAEVNRSLAPDQPGTRYHLEQVWLLDGQPVWFDAARSALSDAPPSELARGLGRGIAFFFGLGVLLIGTGVVAW